MSLTTPDRQQWLRGAGTPQTAAAEVAVDEATGAVGAVGAAQAAHMVAKAAAVAKVAVHRHAGV